MTRKTFSDRMRGFTLIELLIVVAIIAILAAIAVPNFLEAQVRSKVSRTLADMRSMRTALEAYRIDYNNYPETDYGVRVPSGVGYGVYRITTPVAYMTSIPSSPFSEDKQGYAGYPNINDPRAKNGARNKHVLYLRAQLPNTLSVNGYTLSDGGDGDGIDSSYKFDRCAYLAGAVYSASNDALRGIGVTGFYGMKSVGPDNVDNRNGNDAFVLATGGPNAARVYDSTNGTVSGGDIVNFQDTEIAAVQRGI